MGEPTLLIAHHQMQLSVILRTFFLEADLYFRIECSQCILDPAKMAELRVTFDFKNEFYELMLCDYKSRVGLVSLFNDISTFMDFFNAKAILIEGQ